MTRYSFRKKGISFSAIFFSVILLILFNAPQQIVFIILCLYFVLNTVMQHKLTLSMPGWKIYIYFILAGIVIGLINYCRSVNQLYGFVRHVYYILLVGLAWYFGFDFIIRKKCNRKTALSCFVIVSSIRAVVTTIFNLQTISRIGFQTVISDSAANLRGEMMEGSTICLLGLYILIFYPKTDKSDFINKNWLLLFIINAFALFSNFSRTVILDVIILILFSGLRSDGKIIRRIVMFSVILIIFLNIIAPSLTTSVFKRILRATTEMNFFSDNWSERNVVMNWRGYEAHCAFTKFINSNLVTQLIGFGFGTSVSVGKYAYLVTGENTLPFLHNGYFTQLMIFGLSGVVLLICWFISMYHGGTSLSYNQDKHFIHGIVVFAAANTYIVHGLLFSCEQAMVFLLVGSIFALNQVDKYKNSRYYNT